MGFQRVTERAIGLYRVMILTPDLFPFDEPSLLKVLNDPLDRTFGNPHPRRDLPQHHGRRLIQHNQNVCVVGQEGPAVIHETRAEESRGCQAKAKRSKTRDNFLTFTNSPSPWGGLATRKTAMRILETILYATDLEAAETFYHRVIGLKLLSRVEGRHAFFALDDSMLLIFHPDSTSATTVRIGDQTIPKHGSRGAGHAALRIDPDEFDHWIQRFADADVSIEADIRWPGGGRSLYVRDPAGNSLEMATASLWFAAN